MSEANVVLPALTDSQRTILWLVLASALIALLYWRGFMSMRQKKQGEAARKPDNR